ncbi:uncharacterized protein VP01_40g3 [Puccinia sorghi]|uniref:Uncharacterized protein n=1 Tax=Puccinia sorghi TaxID=27349 RepID=A0A0L6URC9_9BASI|nr:uncharacterized protein VP01_40g3 [Puccinia sorghi]
MTEKMPSDLRKRKTEPSELPQTATNPKPEAYDGGHGAQNRQSPTIAPTVFILLIVGLMLALFPVFYYTQVMVPHPDSQSVLSHFRRQGNMILNALGHHSSQGHGRMPFNSQHPNIPSDSSSVNHPQPAAPTAPQQISSPHGQPSTHSMQATNPEGREEKATGLGDSEQKKLDEELGKFWEASSRYRREAQKHQTGEYALRGDGMKDTSASSLLSSEEETKKNLLDQLPDADPDAKDGLTPEFWDAIKPAIDPDHLTLLLNDIRRSEQTAQANKL